MIPAWAENPAASRSLLKKLLVDTLTQYATLFDDAMEVLDIIKAIEAL